MELKIAHDSEKHLGIKKGYRASHFETRASSVSFRKRHLDLLALCLSTQKTFGFSLKLLSGGNW